jgi:hypothetical protein
MPLSQRPAIGSNVRDKKLRKLTSKRFGMTASRTTMSRGRVAVAMGSMREITVIYTRTMKIRTLYRVERRPSRSSGSNSRALNSHQSNRRLTRSTFMVRSIGTTLQTMKIWVQLYYQ